MLGLFLENYADFRQRLRRRLQSDALVDDVMQETYLRVERMDMTVAGVEQPLGYLFRIALNLATDQRRLNSRFLTGEEVDELMHSTDNVLDPPTVLAARQDIRALQEALGELTPRQRAILIAARIDETPQAAIAERFGISQRMVGKELKKALEICAMRVGRRAIQRFGPGSGDSS